LCHSIARFFLFKVSVTIECSIGYVCYEENHNVKYQMKKTLVFTLFAAIFITSLSCGQSYQQTSEEEAMQQSVLDYINQYRKTKGLAPLQMQSLITEEAYRHSKNIATGKTPFGHDGFEQRATRVMKQISQSNAIAENVAYGKFSAQEVVNRWIQSKGHRENIEGKYTLTGVGIYRRNDGYIYFTQIFVNK
jgi:uncharacterized protein YkwD